MLTSRRLHPRVEAPIRVLIDGMAGHLLDVSQGGFRLLAADETADRIAAGAQIDCTMELLSEPRQLLHVAAQVKRRIDTPAGVELATHFLDLSEDDRLTLASFIDQVLAQALTAADRARTAFLHGMSHEIRTPLNGIIGMTQLALQTELSSEQREFLEAVHASGENLLSIVNDILDISKIEAGRMHLEAVDVTLVELIRETMAMFTLRAEQKNLLLRCDIAPEIPKRVLLDPVRLRQVLINLLGNAIKFTERGSVLLEVSLERSPEDAGADSAILRFDVHDTGIGIDLAVQQKLFQAFSQADASTTRRYGGTGLGLFVCKQLVEMMHGTIGVQSARGRGSSFWFTVTAPVLEASGPSQADPVADLATPAAAPSPPVPAAAATGGARVLLAEDNPVNQEIALAMLRSMGCAVHLAADGAQAVAACEEQAFDLIFMDCMMPLMDGLEASRRIRARETGAAHVPIVALTASAMTGDRERCLDAGMDDYLSKPFTRPQLQAMLHKWGNAAARVRAADLPRTANAA